MYGISLFYVLTFVNYFPQVNTTVLERLFLLNNVRYYATALAVDAPVETTSRNIPTVSSRIHSDSVFLCRARYP